MTTRLTCIAVDDEPLALGLVCSFIEKTPYLQLSGCYSNAIEALEAMRKENISLVFLDIQMPDLNGMELARLLNQMPAIQRPKIVFTTAFNDFALEGYKVDALDYLLKPFTYEEFLRATNKAINHYEMLRSAANSAASAGTTPEDYLFLKVEYKMIKISFTDILYIEGLKDYVKLYLQSSIKPLLSLTSLKALEQKLPPDRFMRVHRSFIVSLDKIQSLTRNSINIGQTTITVGEQYKEMFNRFLDLRT